MSGNGSIVASGGIHNNYSTKGGHVRVYVWSSSTSSWIKRGNDIEGTGENQSFGFTLGMNDDGSRIIVGAPHGINNPGYARILEWSNSSWNQIGIITGGNNDRLGSAVAMSDDGNNVIIGASHNSDNGNMSGKVSVYNWDGSSWVQKGNDFNGSAGDVIAASPTGVSINNNGTRIAFSSYTNNTITGYKGYVRLYEWDGSSWIQLGNDINGVDNDDELGFSISMNETGSRIAIGIKGDDGNNNAIYQVGAVRIYDYISSTNEWKQIANDIIGNYVGDKSGWSVDMNNTGRAFVTGTPYADGPTNNTNSATDMRDTGHARVYYLKND